MFGYHAAASLAGALVISILIIVAVVIGVTVGVIRHNRRREIEEYVLATRRRLLRVRKPGEED